MAEHLSPAQRMILSKCLKGPVYVNGLQHLKRTVTALCATGYLQRVAPAEGLGKNMIALTEKGRGVFTAANDNRGRG